MKKPFSITLVLSLFLFGGLAGNLASAQEYRISMQEWEYHPAELTIEYGDTVIWVNDDDTLHNLYFEDALPGVPVMKKPLKIRKGREFSYTFNKIGSFNYLCKIHRGQDMKGKIIVTEVAK